ncbi:MAG: YicC family protein [Chthoniobacterales bacterium]|nr:YicC family protein [Chthoniobacterales bacterium]
MDHRSPSRPTLGATHPEPQARHEARQALSFRPVKSMTGFGRGECISGGTRYSIEISTVNRRNAELVFNLPRELGPAENQLREIIAPAVVRGRATVTASVSSGKKDRPLVDPDLFRRLHADISRVQSSLKIPGEPSLSDVIRLYAAAVRENAGASTPDTAALCKAARAALKALEAMRNKEGAHLAKELLRLLDRFAKEIAAIEKLAPSVTAKHREAMRARLAEIAAPFAADDERLARELALFADRSDITEELSRLASHIAQFRAGLDARDANGRTLDFLAQEMFRECNTIGSKANLAAVTRHVVAAKTELERLREQVQNVE